MGGPFPPITTGNSKEFQFWLSFIHLTSFAKLIPKGSNSDNLALSKNSVFKSLNCSKLFLFKNIYVLIFCCSKFEITSIMSPLLISKGKK